MFAPRLLLLLGTIIGGIWIDALGTSWRQPAANLGAWATFARLVVRAGPEERRQLIWCVLLAVRIADPGRRPDLPRQPAGR